MTDPSAEPTRIPLSRMRRAIAAAMTASALVPQFTIEVEADLSNMLSLRKELGQQGIGLSLTDVLVAASACALDDYPEINASFLGDAILRHATANVGIAVALEEGLIVPVIRDANARSLREIEAERVRLTDQARRGRLTAEEVLSATFTISNLGTLGVVRFRALVVPPQAAILAVGAVNPAGGLTLSLSCDHRAVDGAPAARFLGQVRARLEDGPWIRRRLDLALHGSGAS